MNRHLTDQDIEKIVKLLDSWNQPLTWEAVCQICLTEIGIQPVRQTLMRHYRIDSAFKQCKARLKVILPEGQTAPPLKIALERIERLQNETERLKRENSMLLEQFVVWRYNAYANGLSDVALKKSLPKITVGEPR